MATPDSICPWLYDLVQSQEIATPTLFSPFSYHAGNSLLKWVGISPEFLGTTVMTSRGIIFEYHSYHVLEFRHALSYLCCQLFG